MYLKLKRGRCEISWAGERSLDLECAQLKADITQTPDATVFYTTTASEDPDLAGNIAIIFPLCKFIGLAAISVWYFQLPLTTGLEPSLAPSP